MQGTLAELFVILRLNDEMSKGIEGATTGISGFTTAAAGAAIGAGELAGTLANSANAYNTLDSAAKVLALQTGNNDKEMQNLINTLYSADTSLEEAAGTFSALGQAGVTSVSDLEKVGAAFDTLADAVGVPGDSLTTQLIPAFKAFGVELTDAPDKIDGLATLFQKTNVDVGDFSRTIQRMGPDLSKMGLTMEDVETALVAMSEAGYTGRGMMSELSSAVTSAKDANGDGAVSFDELAAAIGLSTDSIDKAKTKMGDSAGSAQEFADAMNIGATTIEDEFNVSLDKLSIGLGGVLTPFHGIIGGVETFGGAISGIATPMVLLQSLAPTLSAMTGGGIITGLSSLASGIAATGASMTAALIPALIAAAPIIIGIGIAIAAIWALNELGVFDWIIEQGAAFGEWLANFDIGAAFQGILDFFTGLPDMIMGALGGGGGDIAGMILKIIFPSLLILDLLNQAFPQIGQFFTDIGGKVIDFLKSIDPNTIVSVLLGILFPPSIILSALGVNWLEVGEWFADLGGKVLEAIGGIVLDAVKFADKFLPVSEILNALGTAWAGVSDWFGGLGEDISKAITGPEPEQASETLFPANSIAAFIESNFKTVVLPVMADWAVSIKNTLGSVKDAVEGAFKAAMESITPLLDTAGKAFVSFKDAVGAAISATIDTLSGFIVKAGEFLTTLTTSISSWITETTASVSTFLSSLISSVTTWVSETTSAITGFFSDILSRLGAWISEQTTAITTYFADILSKLTTWITNFTTGVTTFFSDILAKMASWISEQTAAIVTYFADIIAKLTAWISEFTNSIVTFFADVIMKLTDWISQQTEAYINFFADIIAKVVQFITDFTTSVVNFFADILTKLTDWITTFTAAVATFFADLVAQAATWVVDFTKSIVDGLTNIVTAVTTPLQQIYDAITGKFQAIWTFVSGIWENIKKAVSDILSKIPLINGNASTPAYASGGYVPQTGLALLHAGEYVVPASQVSGGTPGGGSTTINNYDKLILPNVTNYDEFKRAMAKDQRTRMSYRGVL